ncbi:TauD/TfdA family dioxygenase [Streptomyces sp. NPDC052301]|uniref:TauD/TfdA family dioxygenase n=1 Tax=Streptomyces sp. NPDC052301 TaxID=3365687 RepID=UPI0037D6B0C1
MNDNDTEGSPAGPGPLPRRRTDRTARLQLTKDQAGQALELAQWCATDLDEHRLLNELPVLAHELPREIRTFVNEARLDPLGHVIMLSGNQIDQDVLGATPESWRVADTPASRAYGVLLMLYGALLGDPIGWATQQSGRLVTDVLPSRGAEYSLISASSSLELAWHTEDAHSPYRADWVGLFALRNQASVPTTISFVEHSDVPADIARILAEPRFVFEPDASHEFDGDRPEPAPVPVLTGGPGAPVLRADRDFVRAVDGDPEARQALDWVIGHLDANLYDVTLEEGDVAFVDNRNVVHGRRPFQAAFNGSDRWLKRVNVARDLRRIDAGTRRGATCVIV